MAAFELCALLDVELLRWWEASRQMADDGHWSKFENDTARVRFEPVPCRLEDGLLRGPEAGGGERRFGAGEIADLEQFGRSEVLVGELTPALEVRERADVYADAAPGCDAHGYPGAVVGDAEVEPLGVALPEDRLSLPGEHDVCPWDAVVVSKRTAEDGPAEEKTPLVGGSSITPKPFSLIGVQPDGHELRRRGDVAHPVAQAFGVQGGGRPGMDFRPRDQLGAMAFCRLRGRMSVQFAST